MKDIFCYSILSFQLLFLFCISAQAQQSNILDTKILDSYMLDKKIIIADSALSAQLEYIQRHELNDSLYKYPYYVGKIELLKSNAHKASEKAEQFLNPLIKSQNQRLHYKALLSMSDFYDEIGNNKKSLETTRLAHDVVQKIKDATPEELGKVEYNLGATFLSLGNISEAKIYFEKALKHFESYKLTNKGQLSDGYNAVGATMWMSSKLDSAKYFYAKAVKTIESADGDPLYNAYLGTVIKSNISLLEYTQGNLAEAVSIQNEVIKNYEDVIKNYDDENTVSKARRFQARAISNMAVFYNEQGDLKKAYDILVYAYNKKKKLVEAADPTLGFALIQIGQSQISMREYDQAIKVILKGLEQLNAASDDNSYWKAAGMHALAEAYAAQKNIPLAKRYYAESEQLFKKALGNVYDTEFLSFLRNKALFLAAHENPEQALDIAVNAYDYINKNSSADNFSKLKQILNLAQINQSINDFDSTLKWVQHANVFLDNNLTKADSLQIELYKPELILLKASAEYELSPSKDTVFLNKQIKDLQKATIILENRKTALYKNEDINLLLAQYQAVTKFSKKLNLDLYDKTQNPHYLNTMLTLHESGIYHRIRSRLNLRNNVAFADIPLPILNRESDLKSRMSRALEDTDELHVFFEANSQWRQFLDSLKRNYPKYHKMRYGTIEKSLGNIQERIPENTTLVRYILIDNNLHAFIITNSSIKIYKLPYEVDQNAIQKLSENHLKIAETSELLHQLYQQLWKPFENKIKTKKVVIIPDGELFNLSFEMLTPSKIRDFSEMSSHSLLSKHVISYNYSIFLIDKNSQSMDHNDNFVAFVPEFNDRMKADYKITVNDSLDLDKTYLHLLPQPFTKELAKKSAQLFNGSSFLNEKSTKTLFKNSAKEHKIIHIGTHAESNNISPELSRLVFAKSLDSSKTEDNSLYTYEIYNTNLSTNLAILTACETGKPTYQAGEGMISLAHAFNYAGSESILTSLWKIDEQSSATIISLFYHYIEKGWSKDEALQQAKLDYIATADGRTIHPQYWAGLVLIGDTSSIEFTTNSNYLFWILAIVLIAVVMYTLRKKHVI